MFAPKFSPHGPSYSPLAMNWYFGATRKTLLFPLPVVWLTTGPPFTKGPAVGWAVVEAGAACGSSIDTLGSGKYSFQLFVEKPKRAIQ